MPDEGDDGEDDNDDGENENDDDYKGSPPPFLNPKDDDEDDDDNDKHLLHPPLEVFPPSILLCPGQRFQQLPERHYHHVNHHRVTVWSWYSYDGHTSFKQKKMDVEFHKKN